MSWVFFIYHKPRANINDTKHYVHARNRRESYFFLAAPSVVSSHAYWMNKVVSYEQLLASNDSYRVLGKCSSQIGWPKQVFSNASYTAVLFIYSEHEPSPVLLNSTCCKQASQCCFCIFEWSLIPIPSTYNLEILPKGHDTSYVSFLSLKSSWMH